MRGSYFGRNRILFISSRAKLVRSAVSKRALTPASDDRRQSSQQRQRRGCAGWIQLRSPYGPAYLLQRPYRAVIDNIVYVVGKDSLSIREQANEPVVRTLYATPDAAGIAEDGVIKRPAGTEVDEARIRRACAVGNPVPGEC